MNGGVIEQYDTPENIYRRPATEFVARFIGFENFLDVEKRQIIYMFSQMELHLRQPWI